MKIKVIIILAISLIGILKIGSHIVKRNNSNQLKYTSSNKHLEIQDNSVELSIDTSIHRIKEKDQNHISEINNNPIQSDAIGLFMLFNRLSDHTVQYLQNNHVKSYYLMTANSIDSNDGNKFSEEKVTSFINKYIDKNAVDDYLVIDWESDYYDFLKLHHDDIKFKEAEAEFIRLISFVRELRPEIKVAVYGIPFRMHEKKQNKNNGSDFKFKRLLSNCDAVSPSFYRMNPDDEKGKAYNLTVLENNLEISLQYGQLLNKPVIPFVWELIHNNNKKYGGELIGNEEFSLMIKNIVTFKYQNTGIKGLFWWTPSRIYPVYEQLIPNNIKSNRNRLVLTRDSVILNYFKSSFLNQNLKIAK